MSKDVNFTTSSTNLTLNWITSSEVMNCEEALFQMEVMNYPVFPLKPDKKPYTAHGFKDATKEIKTALQWWKIQYPGAMVGIPTGQTSGILVVDIDCKNGKDGYRALAALEAELGQALPRDYEVRTPSGGSHFYFRLKEGQSFGNSASSVGDGIDIRADGGYVVSEGSVNAVGGSYRLIHGASMPELPDWFADVLIETSKKAKKSVLNEAGTIPEGQRNTGLFQLLASFKSKGLEGQKLRDFALWANLYLCQPPLPESEVLQIMDSVGRYDTSYAFDTVGYAELFADKYSHVLKCVDCEQWLHYQQGYWVSTKTAHREYAKLEAKESKSKLKALELPANEDEKKLLKAFDGHLKKILQNPTGVLQIAASDPKLAIDRKALDSHPLLLNAKNCIVDLQTGASICHDPKYLMTKMTAVDYDPEATSPLWAEFLDFFTDGNKEIEAYLARIFGGIGLVDGNPEEVMVILSGAAKNGKSTFVSSIQHVMGDYTDVLRSEVLVGTQGRDYRHDIADLEGARMIFSNEPPQGNKLHCAFVKELTGGDTIKGRHNYASSVMFKGGGLLVLTTNWEPELPHGDIAMHRRIQLYRHSTQVDDSKRDLSLKEKLKQPEHAKAILAWLVKGRLDYIRQGLKEPAIIKEQISDYIGKKDLLQAFFNAKCILAPDTKAQAEPLFRAYSQFCMQTDNTIVTPRKFYELLGQKFVKTHMDGKAFYVGIALMNQ
jgi:putative DNA primase/helicase